MKALCLGLIVFLLLAGSNPAMAACTNPASAEGDIIYNADFKTLQFCDGTNWIGMTGGSSSAASTTLSALTDVTLSSPSNGQVLSYNGTKWINGAATSQWTTATNDLFYNTGGVVVGGATIADPTSVMDIRSTTKGLLPPRMTTTQRDAITMPATGLMIFNTTNSQLEFYNGTSWNGIGSMTAGTISAFAASSCPSGWTEYVGARGRFLRGIDPSGATSVDPDGTRAPGNLQADMIGPHTHNVRVGQGAGTGGPTGWSLSATSSYVDLNNAATANSGTETRPKNVAVIFCQFTGSGNVPTTATVTGTTNYVAKFTGAQAVGNSQIFDNGTNVGIGTTSPSVPLDILAASSNQFRISGTGANRGGMIINNATGGYQSSIGFADANVVKFEIGKQTDNSFFIYDAANARYPLSQSAAGNTFIAQNGGNVYLPGSGSWLSSGNVGIGTTAPSQPLHVRRDSNIWELIKVENQTSTAGANIQYASASATWDAGILGSSSSFGIRSSGSNKLWLDTSGNLNITGSLTQSSDKRLKVDVHPLDNSLKRLEMIRGVTFHWKDTKLRGEDEQLGVLAQDVRQAFPQLVSADKDGMLSVNYGGLAAPLIEAVKELKADNDNLRADLEDLRREVHSRP